MRLGRTDDKLNRMETALPIDALLLGVFALLALGVIVAGMSDRLRVPASLLFLGIGMAIGDDGFALVRFDNPRLVRDVGVVALLLILFEGGLTTRPADVRTAFAPGFALANVGVLVTAAVVAVAVHVLFDSGWQTAALLGAVVSSTDAAAVFALLRRAPLPRRLGALLEVESGTNDPFAIVLTLGLLSAVQERATVDSWLRFGAAQLVGGVGVGILGGLGAVALLRRLVLGAAALYPVLALALGGLTYSVAAVLGASGFLAVYLCGLLVGALVPRHRRSVRNFHASLANMAEIGLFLLLGLLVFPSRLPGVVLPALTVTAVLILLARPLAVAVCLTPFRFPVREQALVAWAGLRGAVPIVLSTFPFTAGVTGGETIFNVVFFVVIASVLVQGTTVGFVVDRLGLRSERPAWEPLIDALPLEGVEADLVELTITPDLAVAGRQLREVPPPQGLLVTSIIRGNTVVLPTGSTRLEPGDLALITTARTPDALRTVHRWATNAP